MRITRIKNLLPAPKDAEQLYLVVNPTHLSLDETGAWKDGSDGQITVEVWRQKGDDDPTQEGMGDYSVYIYKNGTDTVSVLKKNTPSFEVSASKSDTRLDVRLKVGEAWVETVTVNVSKDGTSIKITTKRVAYAKGENGQTPPASSSSLWKSTVADTGVGQGDWLWTVTYIKYSDNTETTTYSVSRVGIDGNGIFETKVEFGATPKELSMPADDASLDWYDDFSLLSAHGLLEEGNWVWTRTTIFYDKEDKNGNKSAVSYTCSRIGVDGNSVAGVEEYYCLWSTNDPAKGPSAGTYNSDGTFKVSTGWSEQKPLAPVSETPYLWNFELTTFTKKNSANHLQQATVPRCIGNFAKGISYIQELYALSSESRLSDKVKALSWVDEQQDATPSDALPYQWNKTVTHYNDDTEDVFYHISAVKGTPGTGVTISSKYIHYAKGSNGTTPPGLTSSLWKATPAETGVGQGDWLWTRTMIAYSDGNSTVAYSVSRIGVDGNGVDSTVVTYYKDYELKDPETIAEGEWKAYSDLGTLAEGEWLYTRTVITYSDGDSSVSYSVSRVGNDGVSYAGTAEYYALGASNSTPPAGYPEAGVYANGEDVSIDTKTWKEDKPEKMPNNTTPYLWNFEVSRDSSGRQVVTQPICIGNFAKGIKSIQEFYALSRFGEPDTGGDYPSDIGDPADGSEEMGDVFSDPEWWTDEVYDRAPTDELPYQWNWTHVVYNDNSSADYYHVSAVKGTKGTSVTITSKSVMYAKYNSGVNYPASNSTLWKTSVAATGAGPGDWLWTRTVVSYSDGNSTTAYSVSRMGVDGNGVDSTIVTYYKSLSLLDPSTIGESNWKSYGDLGELQQGEWLYARTVIIYSNADRSVSYSISRVGADGVSYAGTSEYYALHTGNSTPPGGYPQAGTYVNGETPYIDTSVWNEDKPERMPDSVKPYLWNFEISRDSQGEQVVTAPICIGNFSKGIKSIQELYAISKYSTPNSGGEYPNDIGNPADGDPLWDDFTDPSWWSDEVFDRAPTDAKPYQWNWTHVVYNDNSTFDTYHVSAVKGGNGVGVVAQYSPTSSPVNYTEVHSAFQTGDKYMRTRTSAEVFSGLVDSSHPWVKVVGENGAETNYTFNISKSLTSANASTAPSNCYYSAWQDGPVDTNSNYPYLWARVEKKNGSGTVTSTKYVRLTGEQGPEGNANSITSVEFRYLATTMATGVTRDTDAASWSGSYQQATEDKPYVWRYSITHFSKTGDEYSDCELVFSYSSGANSNLLKQTNFTSLLAIDKWTPRSVPAFEDGITVSEDSVIDGSTTMPLEVYGTITTGTQGRNAYEDRTYYGRAILKWKSIIHQSVLDFIEPSTWYTLSFWMKAIRQDYIYPAANERTSSLYGFFVKKVYLKAGREYTLYANGYVENPSNGHLLVELGRTFSDGWEGFDIRIYTTYSSTGSITFTPKHTGAYNLASYSYAELGVPGGNCTVNWYRLVAKNPEILEAKFHTGFADTSQPMYVDGVKKTTVIGANCMFGTSSEWVRHTVTFRSASSISGTQYVEFMLHPAEIYGMLHQVYICMPKLEVGLQATSYLSNEGMLHQAQARRRRWAINTQYLAGGVDEPYLDAVLYQVEGETTFSRCIKSHVSNESNRPGGKDGTLYWTSENSAYFENLSTDLFFATKAYIDNLIATLIQTGYEGTPHIEAEGSEFKIFGRGQYPAIFLAVNSDNKAVLRFQNENTGEFLYDLGPDGIMKEFSEVADSYDEMRLKKLNPCKRVSEILNITDSQCTSYYRFNEGYKKIGTGSTATKQYHVSGTASPSAYNACYFTGKSYSGSKIPDGWYCKANNGSYIQRVTNEVVETDSGLLDHKTIYQVNIMHFVSGKLAETATVYFKTKDMTQAYHSVGCDENGSELSTTAYEYLYSYYLINHLTIEI